MPAAITVSRNFTLGDLLDVLPTPEDTRAMGEEALLLIRQRTAAGRDYQGAAFTPYSEAYAVKKGTFLAGVPFASTRVDLTLSGDMLGNMHVLEATEDHVTLGWVR